MADDQTTMTPDDAWNQGLISDDEYTQWLQQLGNPQGQAQVNLNANPQAPQANGFAPGQYYDPTSGQFVGGGIGFASGYSPQLQNLPSNQGIGGVGQQQQGQQKGPPPMGSVQDQTGSTLTQMGGIAPGTPVSQTGMGQYGGLLQSLMQQANTDQAARAQQYSKLTSSVLGKNGYLSQLGKTGLAQLNRAQANAQGGLSQNLVNRGLGNSTIQNSLSSGINRDYTEQKQNLQAAVGGQKAGAAMNLFGMNPTPSTSTYLDLLTRLGASQGGM